MYLFIYIYTHTHRYAAKTSVHIIGIYGIHIMYMCMYVKANAYIRYVTLRYVTLHCITLHYITYMHSSMHTYISMYTLIHLYTCMYRGLLQAVHRERTVKKTHAWHKIYRNYLFSCDIKKPHSQKRKPTKQDPILWALSEANGHTTRNSSG